MTIIKGRGSFIGGSFHNEGDISITSYNPSHNYDPIFETVTSLSHIDMAISAARKAQTTWSSFSMEERIHHLLTLKTAFDKHHLRIAQSISKEMGKVISESRLEAKGLGARIDLMINHGLNKIRPEYLYNQRAETLYHNQGVLAIIGPYNFPAHLINGHIIPAVLTGNTVVVKMSEICPMVGEIYAECVFESSIPEGVINIIQGEASIGKALSTHNGIDGVLFTGSYSTGVAIAKQLLEQPHKILALELGGKNFAVVMDDANLEQALLEIVHGAFATTGQRCTATSRVLCHEHVYDAFKKALVKITEKLMPSDAMSESGVFGPMAFKNALHRFCAMLETAKDKSLKVLLEHKILPGGAYITPSIYEIDQNYQGDQYIKEELFGPNICLEKIENLDQAISRINESPYGLANAIFTLNESNFNRLFRETKSGILNHNKGTIGSLGELPFGGVGKSGNQRPAGILAMRYTTFPVAKVAQAFGASTVPIQIKNLVNRDFFKDAAIETIVMCHRLESLFEKYGFVSHMAALDLVIYRKSQFLCLKNYHQFFVSLEEILKDIFLVDDLNVIFNVSKLSELKFNAISKILEEFSIDQNPSSYIQEVNTPEVGSLERSQNWLDRLYHKEFTPKEKKEPVIDLHKSRGAFLASIDDDPLVLLDAASQIATIGSGLMADNFQIAYDEGQFDDSILKNQDLGLSKDIDDQAKAEFENFLQLMSDNKFKGIGYGASGAEANEIAFDVARQNGPGGTRIIAFEGSFHGRTIMSLHATFSKEKRGPFELKGYEACFLPWPKFLAVNSKQPEISSDFIKSLSRGIIPDASSADDLLHSELKTYFMLKQEIEKGNICAVIAEPMQCEGGDNYASNRFFVGLRLLTRALSIPLIFDEVQTGFHLGLTFFWFQQFGLIDEHGLSLVPDIVTLGKKAQLGVCMSVWPIDRKYSPHVIQLQRGLLQGLSLNSKRALELMELVLKNLKMLKEFFPDLVKNYRACGFAFAFDMPDAKTAIKFVESRFNYGFMAYIAGERTVRFRLNMAMTDAIVTSLFEKLFLALSSLKYGNFSNRIFTAKEHKNNFKELPKNITDLEITPLTVELFEKYASDILALENNTYEVGRRDSLEFLKSFITKDGICLILVGKEDGVSKLIGYTFGGPLEQVNVAGPKEDPLRNDNVTFYSANLTVHERFLGLGFGFMLKSRQISLASLMKENGAYRYLFVASRNRKDKALKMSSINERLKAYVVKEIPNQYGEEDAAAIYYRKPLRNNFHQVKSLKTAPSIIDCRNSVENLFIKPNPRLLKSLELNNFRTLVGSKLTLSNWATTNFIRYSELIRELMPKCMSHVYFTSGRGEVVDKGLRALKFHRPAADIALSFSHQWLGNITAASRSLSHDEGEMKPFGFFDWPKLPHPAIYGEEESLSTIEKLLSSYDASRILGIVVELLGERSALTFSEDFLKQLSEITTQRKIPLIYVETSSAFYKNGRSLFLSDELLVKPNMVWWFTGGQLGHVFVDDQYYVSKPLTLISTWDGDDISIARCYENLLFARELFLEGFLKKVFKTMDLIKTSYKRVGYPGFFGYHMRDEIDLEDAYEAGRQLGFLFGRGFKNSLLVNIPLDLDDQMKDRLVTTLSKILS